MLTVAKLFAREEIKPKKSKHEFDEKPLTHTASRKKVVVAI